MIATGPQSELRTAISEWRTARRLYAVYSGVIAHFNVGVDPCPDLESPIDRLNDGVRSRIRGWLTLMDTRCPVTYLRQVLQRDPVSTEANLRALIRRHLDRPNKTSLDRDKLDFLLVQYFSQCGADDFNPDEPTLAEVGRVLEPVLGHWQAVTPYWLKALDQLAEDVTKCHCMQDLADYNILDRGRDLKSVAGARFFEPPALIAFTRYNIILRRAFFYTMRADLDAVRLNVARLEKLGVTSIDATQAGLSEREAIQSVQRICVEWRSIFRTDYSAGHVFRSIKELRACTDNALAETQRKRREDKNRREATGAQAKAREAAEHACADEAERLGIHLEVDLSEDLTDEELDRALSVIEEAPENTVEHAYPELAVASDPVAGTPARYQVPAVIARIQEQARSTPENGYEPVTARLTSSSTQLAPWESDAFFMQDEPSAAIQASVAARLILQEAFDDFQDGYHGDLPVALTIAHGQAGRMQERIAQARDARDTVRIIDMTATAQRLLELISEAEFAWNEEKR